MDHASRNPEASEFRQVMRIRKYPPYVTPSLFWTRGIAPPSGKTSAPTLRREGRRTIPVQISPAVTSLPREAECLAALLEIPCDETDRGIYWVANLLKVEGSAAETAVVVRLHFGGIETTAGSREASRRLY